MVRGSTQVAAVIGSPVHHSRSPQIANAAFDADGLDWVLVALEVEPGRAPDAVAAVRTLGLGGLMVTMPHKAEVMSGLDRVTDVAAALGAVNSVAWEDGALVGDNTDGAGLVASLAADGVMVAGERCAVLGAGGAARSVILALAQAGAAEVVVINRSSGRAESAAALAGDRGRVGEPRDISDTPLVVNATSVGMGVAPGADGPTPVDVALLAADHIVVDLVYEPLPTPLLRLAGERGARTVDGLGMLVHQAARSLERWTGHQPNIEVMQAAARA